MAALYMFALVCLMLMLGYPVAFTLSGTALLFALIGSVTGAFVEVPLGPRKVLGVVGYGRIGRRAGAPNHTRGFFPRRGRSGCTWPR